MKRLVVALGLWGLCFVLSFWLTYSVTAGSAVDHQPLSYPQENMTSIFWIVCRNNMGVVIVLALGALTGGILTLIQLSWTGILAGVQIGAAFATFGAEMTFRATAVHGALEIPALCLGASAGFVGTEVIWGAIRDGRIMEKDKIATWARYAGASVVLILVAAIVEAYVTPIILGG